MSSQTSNHTHPPMEAITEVRQKKWYNIKVLSVHQALVGIDHIEENQTSKVSVKGLRRQTVNKKIQFLTAARRKIKQWGTSTGRNKRRKFLSGWLGKVSKRWLWAQTKTTSALQWPEAGAFQEERTECKNDPQTEIGISKGPSERRREILNIHVVQSGKGWDQAARAPQEVP